MCNPRSRAARSGFAVKLPLSQGVGFSVVMRYTTDVDQLGVQTRRRHITVRIGRWAWYWISPRRWQRSDHHPNRRT